jgi:putative ABC transport system substrate-binding protein
MKRRDALPVLAVLPLLLGATPAGAQPKPAMRRIGWLVNGADLTPDTWLRGRDPQLRRRGWIPGRNVTYEFRQALSFQPDRLEQYAKELAGMKVDVLVAVGDAAARAAMRATSTIPIVFTQTDDPVRAGLVASFNRPGGNLTGYAVLPDELRAKRMEALRELVPQVRTVAVFIYNTPRTAQTMKVEADVEQLSAQLGVRAIFVYAPTAADTDAAIDEAARQKADALWLGGRSFDNAAVIAAALARNRLPAIATDPELVEAGVLIALGTDIDEENEVIADLVDRILRGAKPGDLPVRQATEFATVVNVRTARTLGIALPPSLKVRARLVE